MTHIWLIWYVIYISCDFKFQFWFSRIKIFQIRPRKFLKSNFLENAWAENFFWLQIRIQRKISRRPVCVHMGCIFVFHPFPLIQRITPTQSLFSRESLVKSLWALYKHIPVDAKFCGESEFEVGKIVPPTHFRENSISKICVGVSEKFLFDWIRIEIWSHMICISHIKWVIYES